MVEGEVGVGWMPKGVAEDAGEDCGESGALVSLDAVGDWGAGALVSGMFTDEGDGRAEMNAKRAMRPRETALAARKTGRRVERWGGCGMGGAGGGGLLEARRLLGRFVIVVCVDQNRAGDFGGCVAAGAR